ncbi:hypothetical protein E2C01_052188 [Portunus trituberculatus]|uniref:Uncharacterized protein n=1 Tax=Portunus trituberculatus TaxID=210409 RepID=A0A5B7GL74_PORTR|nr:hypothetical protein [Portunus trituberculatus]
MAEEIKTKKYEQSRHGNVRLDGEALACSNPWWPLTAPQPQAPPLMVMQKSRKLVLLNLGELGVVTEAEERRCGPLLASREANTWLPLRRHNTTAPPHLPADATAVAAQILHFSMKFNMRSAL